MTWIINARRQHPELASFLTLAIGYAVGNVLLALGGTVVAS